MLSEPFQEIRQSTHSEVFRKISLAILLFSFIFSCTELLLRPTYPEIKDRLECYEIWFGSMMAGMINFIFSGAFAYELAKNRLDLKRKITMILIAHCFQIGSGLWALITQFTITNACHTYWLINAPLAPALWIYVNIHVWLMWFILGVDFAYALFWKYNRSDNPSQ